jgi:hypothetical protein
MDVSFNSTLVRLKAMNAPAIKPRGGCFNSTLVRLKDYILWARRAEPQDTDRPSRTTPILQHFYALCNP